MSRIRDIIVDTYYERDIKDPIYVITHDGLFHTDELMALSFIKLYAEFSNLSVEVLRTRNIAMFEDADLILDVGERNDGKYFDHHQFSFDEKHEDGSPLATAGLVWRDLGRDLIKAIIRRNFRTVEPDDLIIDKIWTRVDERLVTHVDCSDNGVNIYKDCRIRPVDLVAVISMFNDYSYNNQQTQFEKSSRLMSTVVMNFICSTISQMYDEQEIYKQMHYVENRKSEILFIDRHFHLWRDIVNGHFEDFVQYKLLVYPNTKQEEGEERRNWRITSLPSDKYDAFSIRCPAPLRWRGIPEPELKRITGFKQLMFIHKSGFMGSVFGTKEDALAVAKEWLTGGQDKYLEHLEE